MTAQLTLDESILLPLPPRRPATNAEANKMSPQDRAAHDWYRFVLSYPPHLVRDYVERFDLNGSHQVLDPFCGTGTTVVECKKLGIPSVGTEANPMAHFAGLTKIDWLPDPTGLIAHAERIAEVASQQLQKDGVAENPVLYAVTSAKSYQQGFRWNECHGGLPLRLRFAAAGVTPCGGG